MKRQKDRQPTSLFCPGDTFSDRTCNIPYDEIPCPWRSVMPEQTSSRDFLLIFQPYAGMGTPANSAASLHKQEKKNRHVLNSIDFTSLHLLPEGLVARMCDPCPSAGRSGPGTRKLIGGNLPKRVFLIPSC